MVTSEALTAGAAANEYPGNFKGIDSCGAAEHCTKTPFLKCQDAPGSLVPFTNPPQYPVPPYHDLNVRNPHPNRIGVVCLKLFSPIVTNIQSVNCSKVSNHTINNCPIIGNIYLEIMGMNFGLNTVQTASVTLGNKVCVSSHFNKFLSPRLKQIVIYFFN